MVNCRCKTPLLPIFILFVSLLLPSGCVQNTANSPPASVSSAQKEMAVEQKISPIKASLTEELDSVIVDEQLYVNLEALPVNEAADVCRLYCDNYNFTRCRACLDSYLDRPDLLASRGQECSAAEAGELFEMLKRRAHLCLFFADFECAQVHIVKYDEQLASFDNCDDDVLFDNHSSLAELYALTTQGEKIAGAYEEKIDSHLQQAVTIALESGERESKKISAALQSEILVDIAQKRYAEALTKLDDPRDYLNKEYSERVSESIESRFPMLGGLFSTVSIGGDITGVDSDDSIVASVTSTAATIGLVTTLLEEAAAAIKNLPYRNFQIAKCSFELGKGEDSPFNDYYIRAQKLYQELAEEQYRGEKRYSPEILFSDLGTIYFRQSDYENGIKYLKKAVSITERFRSSLNSDVDKIGFFTSDRQRTYIDLVTMLHGAGRDGEALEYAERAKSRALVDMLKNKTSFGGGERQRASETFIQQIVKREIALTQSSQDGSDNQRRVLQSSDEEYAGGILSQPLASLVTVRGASHGQIQGMLRSNETLIEFFGDLTKPFVFIVTNDEIRVKQLQTPDLPYYVGQIRSEISRGPAGTGYREAAAWLYDNLIAPLAIRPEEFNLVIVPHGELHNLPFAALIDYEGNYFVENRSLRLLPAASVLEHLGEDRRINDHILIVSDPFVEDYDFSGEFPKLNYSYSEGRNISNFYPNARHFTGRAATETAVKTYGADVSILHISSHAKFYQDNPLASRLLLAGDAENDGSLNVTDIYDLNLLADLVTLSGCETGLGGMENGDDVIGLTRGLLFAGAKSVVTSLWQVDDRASAILMEQFYEGLAAGSRQQALREAQLRFIRGENDMAGQRYSHPYFWAPFYLTGTAGPPFGFSAGIASAGEVGGSFLALENEISYPAGYDSEEAEQRRIDEASDYFRKSGARLQLISAVDPPDSPVARGKVEIAERHASLPVTRRSNIPPEKVKLPAEVSITIRGEAEKERDDEFTALTGNIAVVLKHARDHSTTFVTVYVRKNIDDDDLFQIPVFLEADSDTTVVSLKRPLLGWQEGEYVVTVQENGSVISSALFSIAQ